MSSGENFKGRTISMGDLLSVLKITRGELERRLGLPYGYYKVREERLLPESQALFKILITMPWILEVTQSGFEADVARDVLMREVAHIVSLKVLKDIGD